MSNSSISMIGGAPGAVMSKFDEDVLAGMEKRKSRYVQFGKSSDPRCFFESQKFHLNPNIPPSAVKVPPVQKV